MAEGVTIYALCHPRTGIVRYVGKTANDPHRRLVYHIHASNKHTRHLPSGRWLQKLKQDGLRPIVATIELAGSDWAEREAFWIKKFRSYGFDLLNLTDGGEGLRGYVPTEEHKEKIAASIRTGSHKNCILCGCSFWRKLNEIALGNDKFCSRKCYTNSLRGVSRPVPPLTTERGVTAAAEIRRARTDCKRGHPLSGDNVFVAAGSRRVCKECRKIHKLTYRAKGGR